MLSLPPDSSTVRAAAEGLTESVEMQFAQLIETRNVMRAVLAAAGVKKQNLPPPIEMPQRQKELPQVQQSVADQIVSAFGLHTLKRRGAPVEAVRG